MLSNLLGNIKNTAENVSEVPSKKRKIETSSTDPLSAIESFCERIYQRVEQYPPEQKDKIEIEARLGLIVSDGARATPQILGQGTTVLDAASMKDRGYRFVPGVDASTFCKVQRNLEKTFEIPSPPSNSDETVFNLSDGVRVKWDSRHRSGVSETKQRIAECNFLLPSAPFDFRITVSMEYPGDIVTSIPVDWSQKRIKRRRSFCLKHQSWRVDLTDVESEGLGAGMGGRKDQSNEVEFEIHSTGLLQWIGSVEGPGDDSSMETKTVASQLWNLVKLISPLGKAEGLNELEREDDPHACAEARERLVGIRVRATGRQGRDGMNFPGAMPVNLCRRHIPLIQKGDYYVTEKTDGVRYLLVVTQNKAVLVDRKMACYRMAGGHELAKIFEVGTVLDGELTYNRTLKRQVFIAFDLLTLGQQSYMDNPFKDRSDVLDRVVFDAYNKAYVGGTLDTNVSTLLVKKRFWPRLEIAQLMKFFVDEEQERVFRSDDKRHHRSDGIIFQPNTPYEVSTHKELLKWKWMDTVTIDLQATERRDGNVNLACGGPNGTMIDVSSLVVLAQSDQMRLLADMQDRPGDVTIAEIAFDTDTGLWTYKMLRPDKNTSNYVATVMSTMIELAEGIGSDELKYRISTSHPSKDDWSRQIRKMQNAAVDFRLKTPV